MLYEKLNPEMKSWLDEHPEEREAIEEETAS
jgi:hypothetical protein